MFKSSIADDVKVELYYLILVSFIIVSENRLQPLSNYVMFCLAATVVTAVVPEEPTPDLVQLAAPAVLTLVPDLRAVPVVLTPDLDPLAVLVELTLALAAAVPTRDPVTLEALVDSTAVETMLVAITLMAAVLTSEFLYSM